MTKIYRADQIAVLEGLEAVRHNPGMYVGDSDKKGLHHLVHEIVDNSIDEAMAGHCDEINIVVEKDGETISVEDNGRGIPVDMHTKQKKSALEVVLTVLHAGGKFGGSGSGYEASGGLHGVGASCVNALSDSLIAEVWKDGGFYRQAYSKGKPLGKVTKVRNLEKKEKQHGTKIQWHADKEIFKNGIKLDDAMLVRRFREMAFLNRGLKLTYVNHSTGTKEEFCYTGGLVDYIKYLCEGKSGKYPEQPIWGEGKADLETRPGQTAQLQIALTYTDDDNESILAFTNNINQPDQGTHVSGFKTALTRCVNALAKTHKLVKDTSPNLTGEDVREGLTAIVSLRFPRPEFVGQTKSKLGSVEAESVASNITYTLLTSYFDKNVGLLKKIVERALIAAEARQAAKKSSDLVKRKGVLGKNRMPGKLYDCNSEKMEECELFLVEGDSAAGSGKDGRDPETQAIMPIRGKLINAEKKDVLANKEVQAIIAAVGTGIKENFDIAKLRYNMIILMADADDDGHHISTLLQTFFYRYMRPLIVKGHLYVAKPPLFCVGQGSQRQYFWSKEECDNRQKGKNETPVRFKGLGEMDAEQLAETTMKVGKRHLSKITLDDAAEADRMVSVLMGSNVALRKEHIVNQINSSVKVKT